MEKTIIVILLITLTTCFVLADEWSDFTDDAAQELVTEVPDEISDDNVSRPPETYTPDDKTTQKPETKLTTEFYIALILILIIILIVVYLIYSFLKRPKDKWKNL